MSYKLSIIQYPSGKFGYAGSVPKELMYPNQNSIGQEFYQSFAFETKEQAIDFASKQGVTI